MSGSAGVMLADTPPFDPPADAPRNPNSALIWLPPITAAGLPVPKTIVVPYKHYECLSIFDGMPSAEFFAGE